MTVLLKAFGKLTATAEVTSLREKVYLVHRNPVEVSFSETSTFPEKPVACKAVFEYRGSGEDEMPVYEFIGLE